MTLILSYIEQTKKLYFSSSWAISASFTIWTTSTN